MRLRFLWQSGLEDVWFKYKVMRIFENGKSYAIAQGTKKSESGDSARREAIGLGIVPQSMVLAWEMMIKEF